MTDTTTAPAQDDDLTPDPALVRLLADRVERHLGTRRTGKVSFADIQAAADADGWPEIEGLDDGRIELLFDDIQTEIG